MAKTILRNASVTVNSVDISDHCQSVEIDENWPDKDVTGMGALFTERLLGIGDASIKLNLFQDFGAASVEATLGPLAGSNTPFPVVVKPDSGAVSVPNPSYTMQAVLASHNPIKGQVGEPSMTDVTFLNADQTGIVKATA